MRKELKKEALYFIESKIQINNLDQFKEGWFKLRTSDCMEDWNIYIDVYSKDFSEKIETIEKNLLYLYDIK